MAEIEQTDNITVGGRTSVHPESTQNKLDSIQDTERVDNWLNSVSSQNQTIGNGSQLAQQSATLIGSCLETDQPKIDTTVVPSVSNAKQNLFVGHQECTDVHYNLQSQEQLLIAGQEGLRNVLSGRRMYSNGMELTKTAFPTYRGAIESLLLDRSKFVSQHVWQPFVEKWTAYYQIMLDQCHSIHDHLGYQLPSNPQKKCNSYRRRARNHSVKQLNISTYAH